MKNEAEIIEEAKNGNQAAMTELINRYQVRLTRFLTGYLGNMEDAMDTAQETFIKLFMNIHKFQEGSNLSTWLYTIAINQAKDLKKRLYRNRDQSLATDNGDQDLSVEDNSFQPNDLLEKKMLTEKLHLAVKNMPEKLKAPFILFYQEKKKLREIAEILSLKENSIKVQLYRARTYLAKNHQELKEFL